MDKLQALWGHRRKSLINALGARAAILCQVSFVLIMLFMLWLFFCSPTYSSACGRYVQEWDWLSGWDSCSKWVVTLPNNEFTLFPCRESGLTREGRGWSKATLYVVRSLSKHRVHTDEANGTLPGPETRPGRDNCRSKGLSLEKIERRMSRDYIQKSERAQIDFMGFF